MPGGIYEKGIGTQVMCLDNSYARPLALVCLVCLKAQRCSISQHVFDTYALLVQKWLIYIPIYIPQTPKILR